MGRRSVSMPFLQGSLLLSRIGWLPMLALGCLLLAAWAHFIAVPSWERHADADRRTLTHLGESREEPDTSLELAFRHAEFRTQLTRPMDRGALLKSLFKTASDAGLMLAQADYRLQPDAECDCQLLQISVPVRGTYPQIRTFIDAALAGNPSLSLDEINLHRESVKSTTVEARLRLTLYLRTED